MAQRPGPAPTSRRVVFVVYPDVQALDLVGPLEVFATTNRFLPADAPPYRTEVRAAEAGPVRTSSGLTLGVDGDVASCVGAIDTLVVVGGQGTEAAVFDDRLVSFLDEAAPRCRRVTSVCSGAFLLARAGLLDGRRATTHWSECHTLATFFPAVQVEDDPIFVRDGDVWTSAGITAGMDLALALVEDDHGAGLARQVARWLVLFVQRPGGQAQYSAHLAAQAPSRSPLREVVEWVPDHLDADCSVPALARRAAMSPRHFARVFRAEVGLTPAAFVEQHRVEAARRLLETTDRPVDGIAAVVGFGTVETFHRAFRRLLGTSPGAYRRRFTTTNPAPTPAPA